MKQGQALALFPLQRPDLAPVWCGDTDGHRAGGHGLCSMCDAQAEPTLLGWEQGEIPVPMCGIGDCRQSWPGAAPWFVPGELPAPTPALPGCSPGTSTARLNFVQL